MFADFNIGDLAYIVIIAAAVIYQLVRKMLGGEQEDPQNAPPPSQREEAPAKEEAKLPYEDLVDQMFGPYIEDRKRKYEARQKKAPKPVLRIIEESPAPELKIIEETPAPAAALEAAPGEIAEPPPEAWHPVSKERKRSLDEIIFRNPRLSPGARLVLATEILNRPHALRNR